jgi:hypothetical protein
MKRILLLLIILATQKQLHAQIAISYFPFQSILSISTNTEKRLFADLKLETNNFVSNLNIELSPKVNFKSLERAYYYVGPGISINPANSYSDLPITNGYFIDFGVRAIPVKTLSNFQVVFEISPYINKDLDGGNIRTRLGFAWNFKNKSKSKTAHE